jgi:hypothetical protein
MRFMAPVFVALGLAASAGAQQAADSSIDSTLVKKIESQMVLPERTGPLSSYDRFYLIAEQNGHQVVRGVYLRKPDGTSFFRQRSTPIDGVEGAFVMKPGETGPMIADGGCSVVETMFDLQSQTFVPPRFVGSKFPTSGAKTATALCHGFA